jgi:hypothetical protein
MSNPVIPIEGYDARESGRAIQEAQNAVLEVGTKAITALLRELLMALKLRQSSAQVEIKINDAVKYEGTVSLDNTAQQQGDVSSLSQAQLSYLQKVIQLPESEQPAASLDQDVTIAVNGVEVFRLQKGVVEKNLLVSPSKQTNQTVGKSPPKLKQSLPQSQQTMQEESSQESGKEFELSPPPLPLPPPSQYQTIEEEDFSPKLKQSLPQSQQTMQEESSQESGKEFELSPPPLPLPPLSQYQAIEEEDSPEFNEEESSFSEEQKQELENLGINPAGLQRGMVQQSQNQAPHTPIIIVLNRELEQNSSKSTTKKNLNFLQSGFQNAFRNFSHKVSSWLASVKDKIIPKARPNLKQDLQNLAVINIASKLLDRFGSRDHLGYEVFETTNYRLERDPQKNMVVVANDGRGSILVLNEGKIESDLTRKDVERFRAVDRELGEQSKSNSSQVEID